MTVLVRDLCEILKLENIESIIEMFYSDVYYEVINDFNFIIFSFHFNLILSKQIQILFITQPGDAKFKANVSVKEKKLIIIGDIDRISMYGKQSSCMEEKKYAGLCFCKTQFTRTAKPIY